MSVTGRRRQLARLDDFFQLDAYQILIQIFHEFAIFSMLSNVVFNVFAAAPPLLEGCFNSSVVFNGSTAQRCAAWSENACEPKLAYEFVSIQVEFGQLCPNSSTIGWMPSLLSYVGVVDLAKFSTTLQMIGLVVASPFSGQMSDLYGRRKTLIVAFLAIFATQSFTSFAPSLSAFVVSRFFSGFAVGCVLTVCSIFVIECLPTAHRFWLCTTVTWAPNYILFSVLAEWSGEWRSLARISAASSLLAALFLIFVLEESPKFLIQKRRKEEAVAVLNTINRYSHRKVDADEITRIVAVECHESVAMTEEKEEENTKKENNYTFIHLYATRLLACRTLVTSYSQFALSTITYSLMFNMHSLGGSLYINMIISGVLRYITGATVALLDHFGGDRIGRRQLHAITFGAVFFCLCVNCVILYSGLAHFQYLIRVFALVAFGITGCIFLQLSLAISELFPTGVRTIASSHMNVCGRLGNIFGPIIFSISISSVEVAYPLLSVMAGAEILLYLILIPETKGKPLPNEFISASDKLSSHSNV